MFYSLFLDEEYWLQAVETIEVRTLVCLVDFLFLQSSSMIFSGIKLCLCLWVFFIDVHGKQTEIQALHVPCSISPTFFPKILSLGNFI